MTSFEDIISFYEDYKRYLANEDNTPFNISHDKPLDPQTLRRSEDEKSWFQDFTQHILPRVLHWQHVNFHGWFPVGYSDATIMGEMLIAILGVNCFSWESCPAATELDFIVTDWLADLFGLPVKFKKNGTLSSSASDIIMTIMLCLKKRDQIETIVTSTEAHSCIEKAARLLDLTVLFVPMTSCGDFIKGISREKKKVAVFCSFGTTSTGDIDDISNIADYCFRSNIYIHVDASYGGNMFIIPGYRINLSHVSSININISKCLQTSLGGACLWLDDPSLLFDTLSIDTPYLSYDTMDNRRDKRNWGIPLTRPFSSLKIWIVLRALGETELRSRVERMIYLANKLHVLLATEKYLTTHGEKRFGLVCFRVHDSNILTQWLKSRINSSGKYFVGLTKRRGVFFVRISLNSNFTQYKHVVKLADHVFECLKNI